jgi:hypothetical protein
MGLRRTGWHLLLTGLSTGAFLVPFFLGLYYGVPLVGFVVGLLIAIPVGVALRVALEFPLGSNPEELLDDLSGEDTAERTANELILEPEPALRKAAPDPTAGDRWSTPTGSRL